MYAYFITALIILCLYLYGASVLRQQFDLDILLNEYFAVYELQGSFKRGANFPIKLFQ